MWFDPLVKWLLKSPAQGLVSNNMLLVTVKGRKSGRLITTPANYLRDGNTLWVVSWRERKWWRNLRGGANISILLGGKALQARGQVFEEEKVVAQNLFDYYRKAPKIAKYVQIGLDETGQPVPADCDCAAQKMVTVRIDLT
jgi:hypothetical protein